MSLSLLLLVCVLYSAHRMARPFRPLNVFFFNDPAPPEIYTLSLHDALPISSAGPPRLAPMASSTCSATPLACRRDRKSTRLNSSHLGISYAVFCLKKKKRG